jgi:glucosamine--fructose-6-phosphate aminotransferase (isomerizing)
MTSRMAREARQAPQAVARLLAHAAPLFEELGQGLRARPPQSILTLAGGSSDHAALYTGYLVMARLGQLVTSLPMSLVTLHRARIACDGLLALAFSQSGQSPDLVEPLREFAARGARTVAFVNDAQSPLAQAAQRVFALQAGPETSVAATKSCICQLVAGAAFVASWEAVTTSDAGSDRSPGSTLWQALHHLPQALEQAVGLDWSPAIGVLRQARQLYVIGRATGWPVAMEMALKLKELCGVQAEAFSGAEVQHGPIALVEEGFTLLVLAPRGPAQAGLLELAARLRERGASVLLAAPPGTPGAQLPIAPTADPELDPIGALQSFYVMVEALACARGLDPDSPRHLSKVTRTR